MKSLKEYYKNRLLTNLTEEENQFQKQNPAAAPSHIDDPIRTTMLNLVKNHFSVNHGIEVHPKVLEGIDFRNPDLRSHIRTVSRRLGL